MRKPVIIFVNGVSGCGKDYLCHGLRNNHHDSVINPVKRALETNLGLKDERDPDYRKLLSDIYELWVTRHPKYLKLYLETFAEEMPKIMATNQHRNTGYIPVNPMKTMTVACRNPRDIKMLTEHFRDRGYKVFSLFINRVDEDGNTLTNNLDNDGDNAVATEYDYDYIFTNNGNNESRDEFRALIKEAVHKVWTV